MSRTLSADETCVLVTGGAGFIGSHTVVELLERGYQVVIVDDLSNSSPVAVDRIKTIVGPEAAQNLTFYEANVLDRDALERIFNAHRIDRVIHFAGFKAVGESVQKILRLPQAELVRGKGFEILCMTDEVDEYIVEQLREQDEKKFCNIVTDDLGLDSEEDRKELEARENEEKEVLDFVKETLGDKVAVVRLSRKLVSAPVCLTTEGSVTLEMERYFKKLPPTGMEPPKAKRVLELNADSHAFDALRSAVKSGDGERAKKLAGILHAQALLMAGEELEDPAAYAEEVCSLF